MYGSLIWRLTTALALTWLLSSPAPALADSCAYASIGDEGGGGQQPGERERRGQPPDE
ncbi:hypothetical protein [Streptomyces sp. col6]|uniref:hypothetical protein n=1 Tax=Streptomyces sp. col6 TaxID=2478958 RepID=UPI001745DA60|nr:hypothetical protein [Streptomyces sp. col6]